MRSFSRLKPETIMLAVILTVAAVMRFWGYSGFSLSNDELSALYRLRFDNFSDLVDKGFYVDGHPGGVQVFLWYWIKLFGNSEASLRLPFVISGILSVLFSYQIAFRWFGRASGLLVASAIAFLVFPLLYSQIARPYGSGLFLVMVMVFSWTHLVFDINPSTRKKSFYASVFAIAVASCMYNHYFSFLMAVIVGITGLFYVQRKDLLIYSGAGTAAVILFLPHVYITLNHLSIGGVGEWLGKPGPWWLFRHVFFIFNSSWLVFISAILIGSLFWILNKRMVKAKKFVIISLLWFLIPFIIGFCYSRLFNPVLQDSALIFSFPFLLFAMFASAGDTIRRPFPFVLALFLITGILSTVVENKYYKAQHFAEFKDVARSLAGWQRNYGADSLTVAVSVNSRFYLDYYLQKENSQIIFALADCVGHQGLVDLGKIVQACRTPYFAYAWTKPVSSVTSDLIRAHYPYVIKDKKYEGFSEVTLYSRKKLLKPIDSELPFKVYHEEYNKGDLSVKFQTHAENSIYHSPPSSLRFDSLIEFGPAFQNSIEAIGKPSFVRARIWAYGNSLQSGANLVVSLESKDGKSLLWESSEFDLFMNTSGWSDVIHTTYLPQDSRDDDVLKIYVWNPQKKLFYVDDFDVELYTQ
jgi:hypothetical protein